MRGFNTSKYVPHNPVRMEIPAVFARYGSSGITLTDWKFSGIKPVCLGDPIPFSTVSGKVRRDVRMPFIAADSNSLI